MLDVGRGFGLPYAVKVGHYLLDLDIAHRKLKWHCNQGQLQRSGSNAIIKFGYFDDCFFYCV